MRLTIVSVLALLPFGLAVPTLLTPPDNLAISTASIVGSEIEESYIVVLKDEDHGVSALAVEEHEAWASHLNDNRLTRRHDHRLGMGRKFGFGKKLRGYSGRFLKETIDEIRKRPEVAFVEPDSVMSIYGLTQQENAPWGLSRISHKINNIVDGGDEVEPIEPTPEQPGNGTSTTVSVLPVPTTTQATTTTPLPGFTTTISIPTPTGTGAGTPTPGRRYSWNSRTGWKIFRKVGRSLLPRQLLNPTNPKTGPYIYDESAGEGQTVYVIDTGVNIEHEEFEGRAIWGETVIDGAMDTDGQGHGTHVAGTIAGKTYGVAKKAKIIAVKVLGDNGYGSNSDVIQGVQWVAADAKKKGKKAIVNMSLGGSFSKALNNAITTAIEEGFLIFVVAAGNDNINAGSVSPASVPAAITVGSTAEDDTRSFFSNYGTIVDVFAPGNNITSAWIGSNKATNTISGTSMAAPHVAGYAAYLQALGVENVEEKIRSQGVQGLVKDAKDSVNLFLYNGAA